MEELITIKQEAVLAERFDAIAGELDKRIKIAEGLAVTEDTYKDAKKIRAQLNKEAAAYADDFKQIKSAVLTPWNAIEDAYKAKVRDKYAEADGILKRKIDEITSGIKQQKESDVRAYFAEVKAATAGVDWLMYDDLARARGIKVGMSDSMKSLRDEVRTYVENIARDVDAISRDSENGGEIMGEYRSNGFCYSQAVSTVHDRIERAQKAKEELERRQAERAAAEERAKAAREAAAQAEPEAQEAPQIVEEPPKAQEKRYTATFTVSGTLDQMKSLVRFLAENGMPYTQIK